eukprot:618405-Pleurochrysis_carterae.AAC.1
MVQLPVPWEHDENQGGDGGEVESLATNRFGAASQCGIRTACRLRCMRIAACACGFILALAARVGGGGRDQQQGGRATALHCDSSVSANRPFQ